MRGMKSGMGLLTDIKQPILNKKNSQIRDKNYFYLGFEHILEAFMKFIWVDRYKLAAT